MRPWRWTLLLVLGGCPAERGGPDLTPIEAARNPERVLAATVAGRRYTLADILASLARRGTFAQERFHAPQARLAYLNAFVDFRTLVAEAAERGLQRTPLVARAFDAALTEALWERGKLPGLERSQVLTEARLRAYHRRHRAAFLVPAKARVSQILIRLPPGRPLEARLEARKRGEQVLRELGPHPDAVRFAEVARRRTEDERSRAHGGSLGLLAKGVTGQDVPAEVLEAAFRLSPAQVSGLVESSLGVHLLRVEEIVPPRPARFEAVRKQVEARLWGALRREAMARLLAALRRSGQVTVDRGQAQALGERSHWLGEPGPPR